MAYGQILVVEDDKKHQRMVCETLEESLTVHKLKLYNIKSVDTSAEAIDYLKNNKVDLLILDLNLKDRKNVEGGFKVLEVISNYFPKTAVIVFTGHGSIELCQEAIRYNANAFLEKPKLDPLTKAYIKEKLMPEVFKLLNTLDATQWHKQKSILRELKEDNFIDKILIPLLVRMGFQNIEKTSFHGFGELGKDIKPFCMVGPFGERNYYAAQVKSGDIDSSAGSKNSVNKLIEQIEKIVFVKFIDPIENVKRSIDKALVIISGDFKGESLRIIQDKFEGRSNIILINGDRLLNLINRYQISNLLFPVTQHFRLEILEYRDTPKNIFIFSKVEGRPSKIQLMEKISDLLVEKGIVSTRKDVLNSLFQRELLGSTGVGQGRALPHITLKHPKIILIICVASDGIDWESLDGRDSYFIYFVFANKKKIRSEMNIMGFLSKYIKAEIKNKISLNDYYNKEKYKDIFKEVEKRS